MMADENTQTQLNDKRVRNRSIIEEMRSSYINYAMSVIVARALPDVKDGLKPVQRRILYAMYKQGFTPDKSYKKSARTVGEVIGKYHPHGDVAVYDAMVRMAQEFSYRYLLVDGQGNFGSIDGDSPAAMRYTEARLHKNALNILNDLYKKTVDFSPTYDGSYKEPVILPSLFPNLLLNGAEGIAVGMATKIPPHNLREIVDALVAIIDSGNTAENKSPDTRYLKEIKTIDGLKELPKTRFPNFHSEIEIGQLLKIVPGPDFPTGGEIYDKEEISKAYTTGRGRVLMRAVASIEEAKGGRFQIIIKELPYQVNKSNLVVKIANLVKNKKIEGISDLRDESNKLGIRVVVDIKRDGKPKTILNKLYKFTEMQKAFNANMLALVDGEPKVLTLKKILELFIEHRQKIVIRRSEFDLAKAREREHILEGLIIALDNLDEVIETIRKSKDADVAKSNLMKKFKLSDIQAQAILDMQLRRLAALERKKIEDEYKAIKKTIAELLKLLSSPEELLDVIKAELLEMKEKFGDNRRTKVFKGKVGEFNEEDLVAKEEMIVTISEQGYIKRMKEDVYTLQKRGGVGKKGMTTKEDDAVAHILSTNTHDDIMFFTSKGRVFVKKVYEIPEFGRTARGQAVINLINVDQNETIQGVLTKSTNGKILDEDILQEKEAKTETREYKYLVMATRKGMVKKTSLSEFENIRSNGLIAIKLSDNDELAWVKPTTGNSDMLLITRYGRAIRFNEKDVRKTGRATMGVIGIKFKDSDDEVIVMDVVRNTEDLVLIVSENGFGKATELDQYPVQKRGGMGIYTSRINKKTGKLASARILDHPKLELLIISQGGQAVRIPTTDLPRRNRQTSGVRLMKLKSGDRASAIAII
ncbi:MAG: DNA gyrase subunit A [Candidatus Dojkabacteria bacterium]